MQTRDAVPGSDIKKNTLVISSKKMNKNYFVSTYHSDGTEKHWYKHRVRNDWSSAPSSKNPGCYNYLSDGVILTYGFF